MISWLGRRFREIQFGHIFWNKITAIMAFQTYLVALSIKYEFDPLLSLIISVPVGVFLLWFTGYIMEITGLRREFMNAQFKDTIMEKNET